MTGTVRHPPGRGGRLWLQRRLATARRGAALLDLKLRILRREQARFEELARRTGEQWARQLAEAERWRLRAAVVAGERGLRPEALAEPADVDVSWASVMGVRYPAAATCRPPTAAAADGVAASAAVPLAADAYRAALVAGVAHAAADAAAQVVASEVRTTSGRLRAIEDRWVPGLQAALHALELSLDELERGDGVRLRWAAGRREEPR